MARLSSYFRMLINNLHFQKCTQWKRIKSQRKIFSRERLFLCIFKYKTSICLWKWIKKCKPQNPYCTHLRLANFLKTNKNLVTLHSNNPTHHKPVCSTCKSAATTMLRNALRSTSLRRSLNFSYLTLGTYRLMLTVAFEFTWVYKELKYLLYSLPALSIN